MWIPYAPQLPNRKAADLLLDFASRLSAVSTENDAAFNSGVERVRQKALHHAAESAPRDRLALSAAINLLTDLAKQRWNIRLSGREVEVSRPQVDAEVDDATRKLIRTQLHAERDAQLREGSVQVFIKSMEAKQLHNDRFVSIFSLMRDGESLATALGEAIKARDSAAKLKAIKQVVRPYLQFVTGEERCEHTGLRLVDIWRYFRHTWANPYKSIPGRSMMVLLRDAAAPFHPVMGIAAVSSPSVGLACRDEFIGWTTPKFLSLIRDNPTVAIAKWLKSKVDDAIRDTYAEDLIEEGVLTLKQIKEPDSTVVERLIQHADLKREDHHRFMQAGDYKKNAPEEEQQSKDYWLEQARTPLFASKRSQELSHMLSARFVIRKMLGDKPTAAKLKAMAADREGAATISKVLRKAKADSVGISIADLTVCGAVAPYNEILGGKLVAMLLVSPEVIVEIRRRYNASASVIASSMAGRAIVRPPQLVFIGTTSLYGKRPSQYDRISVPCERIGGKPGKAIRYEYLGRTEGVGTFQFSERTVDEMTRLLVQSADGQRVNSVFGEGTNPRLRKIRNGLDLLGLPTDELLNHGAHRLVYGVSLATNLLDYLLGISRSPDYLFSLSSPRKTSEAIAGWWAERWLLARIEKPAVLEAVAGNTMAHPIRHRARVVLPRAELEQEMLFDD